MNKKIQMLVGPSTLPERVQKAMCHEAYLHYGDYYKEIQHSVTNGMKKLFKTENDVLTLTTSGTGSIEAIFQNVFLPGEEVIIPITGEFAELVYNVGKGFDLNLIRVDFEYEEEADINTVMRHVTDKTKAVFIVHNESSTGVVNNIKKYGEALKDTNILLIVDSVSGAAGINIEMDKWHIDIICTASQKALMSPPGLSFVAFNEKSWEKMKIVDNQKYYFNFLRDRDYSRRNATKHTPATHTLLAVNESLNMIFEEGLENVYKRHMENSKLLREGVRRLGFDVLAKEESYASPTLTAVLIPGKAEYYVQELAKKGIMVCGGKKPLHKDTFRVGTMGYVSKNDVIAFLNALKEISEYTE